MTDRKWSIYLAGEIHTGWRDEIASGSCKLELPVIFFMPVTDHEASDNCGVEILGDEESAFWKDHKGAKINAIRTRTLIRNADLVIVRFDDHYRQWNAAFDAGFAVALDKPLIVMHPPELSHALKEVNAGALAVAQHPEQVVEVLQYVCTGRMVG
jgi:YtoQ family protein